MARDRRRRSHSPRHYGGVGLALVSTLIVVAGCGSHSSLPKSIKGSASGAAPTTTPPAGYSAWPEAECDAFHSSESGALGPQNGHIAWRANLGGAITGGASIAANGTVYIANISGALDAINPATGHVIWTYSASGGDISPDTSTTPAVLPDGTILYPGPGDTVYGLSPRGKLEWSLHLNGQPLSPVIATTDSFYVMTMKGDLSAVQVTPTSAATRWTLPLGKVSYGSPVIRSDHVIETTVDDSLVAVQDRGASARQLWGFTTSSEVEVSPTIGPGDVTILGTDDSYEYGISPAGKQLWKDHLGRFSYSSPGVTRTGTAYFGDNGGTMTVANASTGLVQNRDNAGPGNIWTSPLIDKNGDVYYGTNDGHIYGFSSAGRQLFDISTGHIVASYPAMTSNGDLLIGSYDGYLYSIGSAAKT